MTKQISRNPNSRYDLILNSHLPELPARVLWIDDGTTGGSVLAPAHWSAVAVLEEAIAVLDYSTADTAQAITFTISDRTWNTYTGEWNPDYSLAEQTEIYPPKNISESGVAFLQLTTP